MAIGNKTYTTVALMVGMVGIAAVGTVEAAVRQPVMEKCYQIVKKGMNDCGTATHSCSKQSVNDGDPEDWMYVPVGSCDKIIGGKLK